MPLVSGTTFCTWVRPSPSVMDEPTLCPACERSGISSQDGQPADAWTELSLTTRVPLIGRKYLSRDTARLAISREPVVHILERSRGALETTADSTHGTHT